ncbi:helix-turn-helix transcriptional regulator [Marinobacter xiaoshiensis]|uniref:AlpA family transcriptional regulator n=1 Tax=Marinobacter xiaoshiensis TaxID=3073652 RepID=A0ABU2HJH8_9GAMM|nr:AlpA family transcriptional regulator [Marinobacter sp. F60267]MDS1311215.1 AlpA family transcriptional regulator [Marinobacter sp. F60267]
MKILRLKQVAAMTGLARSTIYKYVSAGTFPEPIPLGGRSVGWVEAEVHRWITERIENRDIQNHPMNRNSVA